MNTNNPNLDLVKPDYLQAKTQAQDVLNLYDIQKPIVGVFDIASREGLEVVYFRPEGELAKVAGFIDLDKRKIYVNTSDAPQRQLFTVAHELGHYFLNHRKDEIKVLWRMANLTEAERDRYEKEANCFAVNLIVPLDMLKEEMGKYELTPNDVDTLARLFGVSNDVIRYRLQWMNSSH